MLVQLQIWTEEESPDRILSLSDRLARISAWLEEEQGWGEKEVVLSEKPSDLLPSADLTFLSGKMLKESSPQTMAQTFGRLSKPLPTLGVIDLNGSCLTQHGFYPKIESGYTLSDILQKADEVSDEYFLSETVIKNMIKFNKTKQAKGEGHRVLVHDTVNGGQTKPMS
jgi:hypothetical protein